MFSLKDKIIVITGGSGLLGSLYCEWINKAGGVAINADINCNKNLDAQEYYCDISCSSSIKELIAALVSRYGKIDGWVNNAYPRTSDWGTKFENIPIESWRENVDKHQNGYFLCCQIVLEQMRKQGFGSVINLGSIYGIVGPDFSIYEGTEMTMPAAYAAIKGAVINLTRYLASYYGPFGVRVNCISPGGIFDNQPESFVKRFSAKTPLRRMGKPEDIAPAIIYLLSDETAYITGHNLAVDGGWTAI
jgi:NAD(P)-dependent dehydrogenase (short-subunit alcohol dehydrogenase family)